MPLTNAEFETLKAIKKSCADVDDGTLDAYLTKYVAPGLHPMLTSYQRVHTLKRQREWFREQRDADLAAVLQRCRRQVERIGPTVDENGRPMDPRVLERLKAKADGDPS
jgi:hypothetical protein